MSETPEPVAMETEAETAAAEPGERRNQKCNMATMSVSYLHDFVFCFLLLLQR